MKKFFALSFALLASCTEADLSVEPEPPPPPTMGVVSANVTPQGITGLACSLETGGVKSGIVPRTLSEFLGGKFYLLACSAPEYEDASGEAFYLKAGDTVATNLAMVRKIVTPPPATEATIWVTSNVPSAKVDSVVRYTIAGARSVVAVGKNTPYRSTLTADGSLFVYWVSAPGYYAMPVASSPKVGDVVTLQANLKLIPPPPPTPPTTGNLLIASSPNKMNAKISKISTSDGQWVFVANVVTDTVLVLNDGHYRAECTDPSGQYLATTAFAVVNAGVNSEPAVCMMPKVPDDPLPPPPAPAPPTVMLDVTPLIINAGELVTIRVSATNHTGIVVSPLGIVTLGGTFTDRPQVTTQYCAFAFGPGGAAEACKTVTVIPPVTPPPVPAYGDLWVRSIPDCKEAKVYRIVNDTETLIRTVITDTKLTVLAGLYHVRCVYPDQKYETTDIYITVIGGQTVTATCIPKLRGPQQP